MKSSNGSNAGLTLIEVLVSVVLLSVLVLALGAAFQSQASSSQLSAEKLEATLIGNSILATMDSVGESQALNHYGVSSIDITKHTTSSTAVQIPTVFKEGNTSYTAQLWFPAPSNEPSTSNLSDAVVLVSWGVPSWMGQTTQSINVTEIVTN